MSNLTLRNLSATLLSQPSESNSIEDLAMNRTRIAAAVWIVLVGVYCALLMSHSSELPSRMATHFDGAGRPNGWQTRDQFLLWACLGPVLIGLFVAGICYTCRWFPTRLNIPNKEYWTSPERFPLAFDFLMAWSLWFAVLMLLSMGGLMFGVIQANESSTPSLDVARAPLALAITVPTIGMAGMVAWMITFYGKQRSA